MVLVSWNKKKLYNYPSRTRLNGDAVKGDKTLFIIQIVAKFVKSTSLDGIF